MAQYNAIKAAVNAYIKANGRKEITGQILNSVLNATIDSLGRFFQFAGEARPDTDPGTPDQNVTYLAGVPGTYTHFNGLVIDEQEIALLMWNGEWVKHTMLIGIREVVASVDDQVGTPSVDVNYDNAELSLAFHNMKGNPGINGNDGAAAGFGSVTADVDANIGTPGVSVETSGTNTAKNFTFHFTNLKGQKGDTGNPGVTSVNVSVDGGTGVPSATASLSGGVLTLTFHNLKGQQGDTGSSVDYPYTLVNNVTTDDATQGLSAAMGVYLQDEITQLEQKASELSGGTYNLVPLISWTDGGCISGKSDSQYFGTVLASTRFSYSDYIPVRPGDTLSFLDIVTTPQSEAGICFYDADKTAISGSYASIGTTGYGNTLSVVIPNNSAYVRVTKFTDANTYGQYSASILVSTGDVTILDGKVGVLEKKVDAKETLSSNDFILGQGLIIFSNGVFRKGSSYPGRYGLYAVNGEKKLSVTANSTGRTSYAFLSSDVLTHGQSAPYVTGTSLYIVDTGQTSGIVDIPEGTAYIYIYASTADTGTLDRWPSDVSVWYSPGLKQDIEAMAVEIEKLKGGTGEFELSWILDSSLNPDGTVGPSNRGFDITQMVDIPDGVNSIIWTQMSMTGAHPENYCTLVLYESDGTTVVDNVRAWKESVAAYHIVSIDVPDNAKKVRFARYHTPGDRGTFFANYGPLARVFKELNERTPGGDPSNIITVENTDIIFTARNYIVKEIDIEGTPYLNISDDLGVTWHQVENTFGDIMLVHFFRNGSLLICSPTKAYYSSDYENFTESAVYDYDGSVFSANNRNFYYLFADNSDNYTIDGKEAFVWSDYGGPSGYVSRIWYTEDNGHTLRCILRDGATISGGVTIDIRHFHDCRWDRWENCLWITSGDVDDACMLIKGVLQNGAWVFTRISYGATWKLGQIIVRENYLYLVTDFTDAVTPTGLVVVDKANPTSYQYVYKHTDTSPFTGYLEDAFGWRSMFFDGSARNRMLIARGDMKFKQVTVNLVNDGESVSLGIGHPIGPNYNGDLLVTGGTYDISESKLNRKARYIISTELRSAGYTDYAKINLAQ